MNQQGLSCHYLLQSDLVVFLLLLYFEVSHLLLHLMGLSVLSLSRELVLDLFEVEEL
jgi:hypothetical protein